MIDVESLARRVAARRWCPEADTRDSVRARRDALVGLWAGRLMRLDGDTLTIYAAEVHACGSIGDADEIVVQKIWYDFGRAGVAISTAEIRQKLDELERTAVEQLALAARPRTRGPSKQLS